jgi:hypothetical protein
MMNCNIDNALVKPFDFRGICEAEGCTTIATATINVDVGDLGSVTLYLCEKCVLDFRAQNDNLDSNYC